MSPRGYQALKSVLSNLKSRKLQMPYYAVARGREVGVFQSWSVCQELTANFKGAKYKKFESKEDAWDFIKLHRHKSVKPTDDSEVSKPDEDDAENAKGKKEHHGQSGVSFPNDSFDFAAFSLRLTTLENNFQEKIRSLEERVRTLENRKSSGCDNDEADCGLEEPKDVTSQRAASSNKSNPNISSAKRKLLATAGEIIQPGPSRSYSTSAAKKLKISEEDETGADSVPFQMDSDGHVKVYTDGACPNNALWNAKAGIGVWFNDGHPLNVSAPVIGRATNNVAELQAATVAVQVAAGCGIKKLCIITDSQFIISCMTDWIHNWKRNNWKTYKGNPVINKEEIIELDKICSSMESVKWVHVRGHQGVHGNERADQLAREGAEMYKC